MPTDKFYSRLMQGERDRAPFFALLPDDKFEELVAAYAAYLKEEGDIAFLDTNLAKAADGLIGEMVRVIGLHGKENMLSGDNTTAPPEQAAELLIAVYDKARIEAFHGSRSDVQPPPERPKKLREVFERNKPAVLEHSA